MRKWSQHDTTRFRALIRLLRDNAPTTLPVKVRREALRGEYEGYFGTCSHVNGKRGHYFYIKISPELFLQHAEDILLHEWAHALTWWRDGVGITNHSPDWGVAYAQCYRIYLNEREEE